MMVVGYQDGLCWVGISSEMEYSGKGSSNQTAKCHMQGPTLERQKKLTENLTLGLHQGQWKQRFEFLALSRDWQQAHQVR